MSAARAATLRARGWVSLGVPPSGLEHARAGRADTERDLDALRNAGVPIEVWEGDFEAVWVPAWAAVVVWVTGGSDHERYLLLAWGLHRPAWQATLVATLATGGEPALRDLLDVTRKDPAMNLVAVPRRNS